MPSFDIYLVASAAQNILLIRKVLDTGNTVVRGGRYPGLDCPEQHRGTLLPVVGVFGEKVVVEVPAVMPSAYALLSIWLFVVSVNGFGDAGTAGFRHLFIEKYGKASQKFLALMGLVMSAPSE